MPHSDQDGLSQEEVGRLFGAVISHLRSFRFIEARTAVAAAGITGLGSTGEYWAPLLEAADDVFHSLSSEAQRAALTILATRMSEVDSLKSLFLQHGFQFIDGVFVPIGILDQREAKHLPQSSAAELAKAAKRLAEGDETGAITSACGAVDGLMQRLYTSHELGDPGLTSFAAKVGTAIQHLQVFEGLKSDLTANGVATGEAEQIVRDIRKATNHAAHALQTLRKRMGDVHGSRPALRRMAYDSMKWASAICGLFEGRV